MLPRLFLTILPVYSPNVSREQNYQEDDNYRFIFKMHRPDTLSFYGRQLKLDSESEIAVVVKEITAHGNLVTLDFRGNTLSVAAGKAIAEAIKTRPELKECIWSDMFTGRLKDEIPKVIDSLGDALSFSQCRLTTLDLSDNAFGAGLSESLSKFLQSPALFSLENLILNNNGLGLAGVTVGDALCKLLQASKNAGRPLKLKKFVCGRNRLEVDSTIALTNAFIMMQTLEEVYLPQNGIKGNGIEALAQAFGQNRNLRVIDLNDNICRANGAIEIAEVLPMLPNLELLNLGDCVCETEGAVAVVAGLESCTMLKNVVLSGNSISAAGADEIGEFFSRPEFRHVKVDLSMSALGRYFDEIKEKYAETTQIDFGDIEDDEGGEDSDEEGAEDASMEEDANTSRETVIVRPPPSEQKAPQKDATDDILSKMLSTGIGCMKITEGEQKKDSSTVSFLDRSLKLDTAESAREVVKAIRDARTMKVLELRGNTLGKEAGDAIAAEIEKHKELDRCLWSDMFTGRLKNEIPPILEALGRAMIKAGCNIRELDLSDNAFGPIGADALKELLESPTAFSLETLRLNNNGLGIGGKQIAKSLTKCLQLSQSCGGEARLRLKTFIAGRNRLENPGAHALAATFKDMGTIEWFDVRQNGIHEEGVRALVAALKHNYNLRHLWLEDNTVLPKGAKALAKTLESWPKLEVLNLGDCLLKDAGCNYIVDHLNPSHHRQLKNVYLSGNELTPPTALLLIRKWSKFDGLNPKPVLHINANSYGDSFAEVAAAAPENVIVGDEEDDLGSLDGDAEEYNSKSSSDDADLESEGDDNFVEVDDDTDKSGSVESDNESHDGDHKDIVPRMDAAQHSMQNALALFDQMEIDFESRFQEDTAKVILQLSRPLEACNMNVHALTRAVEVAENIVKRVAAVKRNPIPATTQLINNIVAQCKGSGVKPEVDWGYNANPKVISRLLEELIARGHFKHETELIKRFFSYV